VTRPLEDAVAGINGVKRVVSSSTESFSRVGLELRLEIDPQAAAAEVREKVAAIRSRLPAAIEDPTIVRFDVAALPIMTFAVGSGQRSDRTRVQVEDDIKPLLEQIDGVAAVEVNGGALREIQVDLDPRRLEALGLPVWLDRHASEADWIGLVNRVKPHTDFKGSIESGLFKMMTIGLGKHRGAIQYHRANIHHGYETVITAVGREMLVKARIAFGVGVVENGYDETARLEAFNAADLESGERRLLKDAREWMARLPFSPIDVLVVEEMGKNVSGAGMDSNVIGRPTNPHEPFPADPRILWIVVLDLTEESYGNATGIGNADFTTRKLVDKIDMKPTLINCITACAPGGAKVPATYETDREAIETALSCIGLTPSEQARVIRIKNTLMLSELEVSEALLPEVARRPDLTPLGAAAPLAFDAAGRLLAS
jgi:hypothetical protein